MKKFLFLVVLATSFSASAFFVQGQAQFNQAQGSWFVCNNFGRPIYCDGNVYGQTRFGATMYGTINGPVYPGSCINGYVYANNPYADPLVIVNGQVDCQWY